MKNRLSKILAAYGIASRRHAESLIQEGLVEVNGKIVTVPQTLIDSESDRIRVEGKLLKKLEEKVVYLLNKPKGYVCSASRKHDDLLAIDLLPPGKRLFTVGRLDKETTGLLIVTNDGDLAQRIIHPSANIQKEYIVKLTKPLTDSDIEAISHGCSIEGKFIKPVKVALLNRYTLHITVKEGKKHEVRLFVENTGHKIAELKRVKIGPLNLGRLPIGDYRKLTKKELAFFHPS